MTLANAFTVAWKDLKTGAAKVAEFLTKNQTTIKTVVSEVGTVVAAIDPALAPAVTVFDQLEEQVVGKVLELANDAANANSLAELFGAAWPVILSLKQHLSNHPAVQSAAASSSGSAS
jgi:hypothetical protein